MIKTFLNCIFLPPKCRLMQDAYKSTRKSTETQDILVRRRATACQFPAKSTCNSLLMFASIAERWLHSECVYTVSLSPGEIKYG
jgi:hypothetical protein